MTDNQTNITIDQEFERRQKQTEEDRQTGRQAEIQRNRYRDALSLTVLCPP